MPEEIKGLLRALIAERDEDREVLQSLHEDVRTLASRYRRSRWERAVIVVVLAASIALGVLYVVDAHDRRVEFRQQLHDLACLAVRRTPAGVSETVDDLRGRYGCPPYSAAAGRGTSGPASSVPTVGVTATKSTTRTVTATATATATVARRPGPTVTVTAAGSRVTRVVRPPARTVTATVTVTASPACVLIICLPNRP